MSSKKTEPLATRRKPKVRPSGDRTEGAGTSVLLPRRTPQGSPLRLGTISWGVVDSWRQSSEEFLASLAAAPLLGPCDLIVAAGLTVTTPPQPQAVLEASAGTPVLFEVDAGGEDRSWLLAHGGGTPQVALLRQRQLVEKYDHHEGFRLLADAIADEAGVITFEGTDLRLVLFICGENNLVAPDAARSVFKRVPDGPTEAGRLRELLGGPWLMLNPAHAPYYPPIRSTGFAKVGVVRFEGGQAGPTLRRLVEHEGRYRDGTAAPVGTVHVNNFDTRHPTTEEYAAVAFGDTPARVRRTLGPATGEVPRSPPAGTGRWIASVYEVSTGPLVDTTN